MDALRRLADSDVFWSFRRSPLTIAAALTTLGASQTLIYAGAVGYTSTVTFTKPATQDNAWTKDRDEGTANFYHTFNHCAYSAAGDTGVVDAIASVTLTATTMMGKCPLLKPLKAC